MLDVHDRCLAERFQRQLTARCIASTSKLSHLSSVIIDLLEVAVPVFSKELAELRNAEDKSAY